MILTGIKYKVKRKALHTIIKVDKPINVIIVELSKTNRKNNKNNNNTKTPLKIEKIPHAVALM